MTKFCSHCGKEIEGNSRFCPSCGVEVEHVFNGALQERDIATCVILSFITCGIYGLYWYAMMSDESNELSDITTASGGMAILYMILSCGIYYFYWNYKMGQKLYLAGKRYGIDISDNAGLYLILSLLGLGIVSECLIQSDLNRLARAI